MSDSTRFFARSSSANRPNRPDLRVVREPPAANEWPDVDLVRLSRDPALRTIAAKELLRRYHPMVLRILRRSLGPDGEATDLAQEVFLRLFSRLDTIRDGQALKAFVIAFTVNVLKWELRRRELRRMVGLGRDVDTFIDRSPLGVPDEDAREAMVRFQRILAALKPRDRMYFSLRFMEEMTIDEIAAATGVPPRTLKRHLTRIWTRVVALATRDEALAHYVQGLDNVGVADVPGAVE